MQTFQGPHRHFEVGGPILTQNFEIFQKMGTYLVNPKILGGPWPPWPPTKEAPKTFIPIRLMKSS